MEEDSPEENERVVNQVVDQNTKNKIVSIDGHKEEGFTAIGIIFRRESIIMVVNRQNFAIIRLTGDKLTANSTC